MRTFYHCWLIPFFISAALFAHGRAADSLASREWKIDGVTREALVYTPPQALTSATPVIFAFHGHGGNMRYAARAYGYHSLWPEAMVVYLQGLPTPGALVDPEGKKNGWQRNPGDQGDRDLKFFDAVLASLTQEFQIDAQRLYVAGHSNGGLFTYLLWATRGDKIAAFAPAAAIVTPNIQPLLKPKPALIIAGRKDELVKFSWQEMTMTTLRRINQCGEGQPWKQGCTLYPSKVDAPVVTFIYPGTHTYPAEAPALTVAFFKEHAKAK